MIRTRIGPTLAEYDGYAIVEVFEQLPDGGERTCGYSLSGPYSSPMVIYSVFAEAREAVDDLLRMQPP